MKRCEGRLMTAEARRQKIIPPFDQCYRKAKYVVGDHSYCTVHAQMVLLQEGLENGTVREEQQ